MLPLAGNTTQTERFSDQVNASVPLKKQLWQQTVQQRLKNQAYVLEKTTGAVVKNMLIWAENVKSGDTDNHEARAAVYYWTNLFPKYRLSLGIETVFRLIICLTTDMPYCVQ